MAVVFNLTKLFLSFLFIFVQLSDRASCGVVVFNRDDTVWLVETSGNDAGRVWLAGSRASGGGFPTQHMSTSRQQFEYQIQDTLLDTGEPDGDVDEMTGEKPLLSDWPGGTPNQNATAATGAATSVWSWQQQVLVTVVLTVVGIIGVTLIVLAWLRTQMSTSDKEPESEVSNNAAVKPLPAADSAKQCIVHPAMQLPTNTQTVVMQAEPGCVRVKVKGLLERRGSSASLTIDLMAQEPTSIVTPTTECSVEEFLLSTGHLLTRSQLGASLQDPQTLHKEFWELPLNHPECPSVPGCGHKNRYRSILPNEKTRVKLAGCEDKVREYVNANYIKCVDHGVYIATQGPLENTIGDFYAMIWQQRVPVIVMVTRLSEQGRVKCEQYLPEEEGVEEERGELGVTLLATRREGGHTRRVLQLRVGDETRQVLHFCYETWPDHKTPAAVRDLLVLAQEVESLRGGTNPGSTYRRPANRSPLSANQITPCSLLTNQSTPSPLSANRSPLSANQITPCSLLTNQSTPSPLSANRSPLSANQITPCSLLTNQSMPSPLSTNRNFPSPLYVDTKASSSPNQSTPDCPGVRSPSSTNPNATSPLSASRICPSPLSPNQITPCSLLTNQSSPCLSAISPLANHLQALTTNHVESAPIWSEEQCRSPKKAFDFSPKQIQPSDSPKSPRPAFDWSGKAKHFSFEPSSIRLVDRDRGRTQDSSVERLDENATAVDGSVIDDREAEDGEEWRPSVGLSGPVLVHCSAGIGRTGCFIAVSIGIQQLLREDCVDVLGIVCQMRADRGGMIQTAEQYEFIHRALHMFEQTMSPRQ